MGALDQQGSVAAPPGVLAQPATSPTGTLGPTASNAPSGALGSLFDQARQQFPRIPTDIAYRESFGKGDGYLEFYPKGERDSYDPSRPAIEVFNPKTKPMDIAGDIVSHHMVDHDPVVGQTYRNFLTSMQPWQQKILQAQYDHAKKNDGEDRPFPQWAEASGQPAYFRGYAFQQWPNADHIYTPQQIKMFDSMMSYLRGGK